MHILLITHFFPPKHNAGTENYTLGIAKALMARGHDVQVLCAEGWESGTSYWNGVTAETYQGILVNRIHINWTKAKDPNRFLYENSVVDNWLFQYLKSQSFDIVHITSAYSFGVGILRYVQNAGIPMVLTLMDFWFLCPSVQLLRSDGNLCDGKTTALQCQSCMMANSNLSRKLSNIGMSSTFQDKVWTTLVPIPILTKQQGFRGMLLNMSERKHSLQQGIEIPDVILSHSEFVKDIFAQHTAKNIMVIKNGQDLSWLKNYNGRAKAEKLRFGYVGQIATIKGVHVLVEAFKKANVDGKAELMIWGDLSRDLPYVNKIKDIMGDETSVLLRGGFDHDNLDLVLSEIDVMVVPSIWYENAPLVIQEAFAAKIPVIATNLGGMSEAVDHEVNGLLFERGNSNDLAKQIERLIWEPELLSKLMNGIPAVKTVEYESSELEIIYKDLVNSYNE